MKKNYMHEISYNYDSVREYCVVERVDEEYFRASMRQKEKKYKLTIMKIIMCCFANIKGVMFNKKC